MGNLATKNANGIKYIAVGSSLSAGVRDGGVYAEAQKTSFPALLAQQMGIKEFKQPLLDDNGTGKKTASIDKNGILKFTETPATYNDKKKETKLPKVVGEVDNLAVPYQKVLDLYEPSSDNNPFIDKRSFKHLERLLPTGKESYLSNVNKLKNVDFFTYELGFYDYIQYVNSGGFGTSILYMGARENYAEIELLNILASKKAKGVIANVPDVLDFPIYRYNTLENIKKSNSTNEIFISYLAKSAVRLANNQDIFLPTENVSNLLNSVISQNIGLSIETPLFDSDVLSIDEIETISVNGYNNAIIEQLSQKYQLPIVDLYTLYKNILKGNYLTDDGVLIDPSYPNGNFFSSDGITPTALGQSVIANEFIKVINSSFSAKIPLIQTKKFIEK